MLSDCRPSLPCCLVYNEASIDCCRLHNSNNEDDLPVTLDFVVRSEVELSHSPSREETKKGVVKKGPLCRQLNVYFSSKPSQATATFFDDKEPYLYGTK